MLVSPGFLDIRDFTRLTATLAHHFAEMLNLEEYYATNYSKCNLTYSFWASWKGLAYPTHSIQVIALPLQIFTFYIIWKYTPAAMKAMKWPLLINHLCCSVFDFSLCTLSAPYFFWHNVSFFGEGVFHWLGVSNGFQILTVFFSATLVPSSYIYVFESRSHLLSMNRWRIGKKWKRIIYHSAIFIVHNSVLLFGLQFPEDQNGAKLKTLEFDPCPTREYFMNDVLVLFDDLFTIRFALRYYAPMLATFMIFHASFPVICTVYYLFIGPTQL
ncbi:unnamed protein product [Caenorhabditis brenneri]